MATLQITTLDEFHQYAVQAIVHFPALAVLIIIWASIVCAIVIVYKYQTKQIAKDEAIRYAGMVFGHCIFYISIMYLLVRIYNTLE